MRATEAEQQARRAPLRHAIDHREVQVVFQPVVDLSDRATIGYEALARLGQQADLPGPWFRLARETGLDTDLELACLSAVAEIGLPPNGALLFVNISASTLMDERVQALCAPIAPRLVVELTEHEHIDDYEALRPCIERWSALGVRLAVDDTGAGYSSLRHVLELSPDFLKLDRSVIGGLHEHSARRALVAALSSFADDVGTAIVAEGVELRAEADALYSAGVHLAQGFAFGRPQITWVPGLWPSESGAAAAAS